VLKRDRELLARVAQVHRATGDITLELLALEIDDKAYSLGLRQIGQAFGQLATELVARAEELNASTADTPVVLELGEPNAEGAV